MKNIFYVNAQEMAKKHPDTFEAPTKEDLDAVKVGDSVKVCANQKERFWVTVTEVNNDDVIGTVDNDLVSVELAYDETIKFKKENIYSIYETKLKEDEPDDMFPDDELDPAGGHGLDSHK